MNAISITARILQSIARSEELVTVGLNGGDASDSTAAVCVDLDPGVVTNGEEWTALVRRDRLDELLAQTGATIVRSPEVWDGSRFGDGTGGTVERHDDGDVLGLVLGSGLNRRGLEAAS